jgi:hypothetical protein
LEESAVTAGAKVTAANQEVANAKRTISYAPNIAIINRKICYVSCAQWSMNNLCLH